MKDGSVIVPESIAGVMNSAITDSIVNSENYKGEENYNCFACAYTLGSGENLKDENFKWDLPGDVFEQYVKAGFEKSSVDQKVFGKTLLAWRGNVDVMYFGFKIGTEVGLTHAATYLGTSQNGTEYTFTKNGLGVPPKVMRTADVKGIYGNRLGYWNKSKN